MPRPSLALYQPDIPQNTGAILRLAACLHFAVEIIEPCGFLWDEKKMRRVGMDYLDLAQVRRHSSWEIFQDSPQRQGRRLVLLTTAGAERLDDFRFTPSDILLAGRESAGVPETIAAAVDQRIRIPMTLGARSLNVAMACAIVMAEALRQTQGFPNEL